MKLFPPRIGLARLSIVAVGVITGIGAVFFRALIRSIDNVAFFGAFNANVFKRRRPPRAR
jgi:CIC family chloride channel protein